MRRVIKTIITMLVIVMIGGCVTSERNDIEYSVIDAGVGLPEAESNAMNDISVDDDAATPSTDDLEDDQSNEEPEPASTIPEEQPATPPEGAPAYITIRDEQFCVTQTWVFVGRSGFSLTNEELEPLRYMTNLTSLSINDSDMMHYDDESRWNLDVDMITLDLTPLARLTNLTHISLPGVMVSDLSPLAGLTNLTTLILGDNPITDLTPLMGLTNLTELNLSATPISDLTPLESLTNLEKLIICGFWTDSTFSLEPLADLSNLRYLRARNRQLDDDDIISLAGLMSLQTLDLSTSQIRDITPLANLGNLENLAISNNHISDIAPLAGLKSLEL